MGKSEEIIGWVAWHPEHGTGWPSIGISEAEALFSHTQIVQSSSRQEGIRITEAVINLIRKGWQAKPFTGFVFADEEKQPQPFLFGTNHFAELEKEDEK